MSRILLGQVYCRKGEPLKIKVISKMVDRSAKYIIEVVYRGDVKSINDEWIVGSRWDKTAHQLSRDWNLEG